MRSSKMTTYYELMDLDSANVVGFYDTKEEAFATIRESYERYGLAGIADLALSEKSDEDEGVLLGEGEELLDLAMAAPRSKVAG
jgi:hypothetical protein